MRLPPMRLISQRYYSIEAQWDADALYRAQFATRGETNYLRYVGTSTIVRDIDYLNTLLEGKGSRLPHP